LNGLEVDSKRITKLRSNGTDYVFDSYVVNADIASFLTKTIDNRDRKKYTDTKLENMKYSCSTFMLYLGVSTNVDLPHHSVTFSSDYKNYLNEIDEIGKLPNDPSFYICNASATDNTVAPEGKSSIYILSPVPNLKTGSIDWKESASTYRATLLRSIRERLGIDLEPHIEVEHTITPLEWRDNYNVAHGAVFSLQHTLDQLLIFRPKNRFDEFTNMYLVGGSTHPGSGLPTIFQSAQIAADLINAD
jgi:phytoene desaturase